MIDETEDIRKQMIVEINAAPGSREYLEPSTGKSGTPGSCPRSSRCWALWHRRCCSS